MFSNLFLRVFSALIMGPVVLIAIWYGKPVYEDYSIPLYNILLAMLGVGLVWEWEYMFNRKKNSTTMWMALTACFTVFLTGDNPAFALWMTLLGTTMVFWKSRGDWKFSLGTLYICLPLLSLGYLYYVNENISREIVMWLFFVVWATDIGGYVVGSSVKGPKIAPKISAGKTWSGLVGAILFAMAVAYVFALYLRAYGHVAQSAFDRTTLLLVISAGLLAVVSQTGDFFESFIKRRLGLKDSSNLIPGHGGLFDRVDGLLFASVPTALVLFMVNNGWIM